MALKWWPAEREHWTRTGVVVGSILGVVGLGVAYWPTDEGNESSADEQPTARNAGPTGWGPARPVYMCKTPEVCPGADHVVFDSYTNNPVAGDERPFLAATTRPLNVASPGLGVVRDRVGVEPGDAVYVRAYINNAADYTLTPKVKSTARGVWIKAVVPAAANINQRVRAEIGAINASPKVIWDDFSVYSDRKVRLTFVPGSATFTHKPDGLRERTDPLSDSIVAGAGAPLGSIGGSFAESGWIVFQLTVSES